MSSAASKVFSWVTNAVNPPEASTPGSNEQPATPVSDDEWHDASSQLSDTSCDSDHDTTGKAKSDDHPKTDIDTDAKDTLVGGTESYKTKRTHIMHHIVDRKLHEVAYSRRRLPTEESRAHEYQFQGLSPAWGPSSWYTREDVHKAARSGTFGNEDDDNLPYLIKAAEAMTWRHKGTVTDGRGEITLSDKEWDVLKWQSRELPGSWSSSMDVAGNRVELDYRAGKDGHKVKGLFKPGHLSKLAEAFPGLYDGVYVKANRSIKFTERGNTVAQDSSLSGERVPSRFGRR